MEPKKPFRPAHLPLLSEVILKVKQLQELTKEEQLVYLICIEEMREEEAIKMIAPDGLLDLS